MSAESSERVKVIFPVSVRVSNKDEGWYTIQVTFKSSKSYAKTIELGLKYFIRKLLENINGQKGK